MTYLFEEEYKLVHRNLAKFNQIKKGLLMTTAVLSGALLFGVHSAHADELSSSTTNSANISTTNVNTIPENINGYVKQGLVNSAWENSNGQLLNGWQTVGSDWYHFSNGTPSTGWQSIDDNWYYMNQNSAKMEVGLQNINNQTYYLNEQHDGTYGAMKIGWQYLNNHWYYFQSNGAAQTGWADINNAKYYLDPNTAQMATGDTEVSGLHYYFDPSSGHQIKGMVFDNASGKLSYYDDQTGIRKEVYSGQANSISNWAGQHQTSELKEGLNVINGQEYYYDSKTKRFVSNEWKQINNKWYYFGQNGQATKDWYKSAAGNWYYFTDNGSAQTGWFKSKAGCWYYFDPTNAWAQKGWFKSAAGLWYYFDPQNVWAKTGWFWSGYNWYYFDSTNTWADTGWQYINNKWYYFDKTNAWADTGWQLIDGAWYYFKSSCAMAANEAFTDGSKSYEADVWGHTHEISGHAAFLASIKQAALDGWRTYGVLPSVTAAQAILESAWGQSRLATEGHNLFGIKGSYNGQSITMRTAEYGGGGYYYINAAFRRYQSNYESVVDHGRFLAVNSRYHNLLWNRNYRDVTAKLQYDGYATAPTYAASLNNVIVANGLAAWDSEI
ncbi:hypothetical protein LF145_06220 [Limosilactobacillus frumenti]|nr:hypothetical protein LF145_06220 [Limosilactobacillus frumenti]